MIQGGRDLAAGPASLLLHRHDDLLSNQRQLGVLGALAKPEDRWLFRPDRLLPNMFPDNPIEMMRTLYRARGRPHDTWSGGDSNGRRSIGPRTAPARWLPDRADPTRTRSRPLGYFFSRPPAEPAGSLDSAAMKASCGTSTRPTIFIRFLPSFCFSSSLRLRVMSPP